MNETKLRRETYDSSVHYRQAKNVSSRQGSTKETRQPIYVYWENRQHVTVALW